MTHRLLLVVLIALTGAGCATGGYVGPAPYPGPLGRVVAGNLALTCPGSVYLGPPVNRCADHLLIGGKSYWGYYDWTGRFIPVYGPGMILLSTGAGALLGYAIGGNAESIARGAAAGLGAAVAIEVLQAQRRAGASPYGSNRSSFYAVRNPTDYVADIFDGRKQIARLGPNDQVAIPEPQGLLTARIKVPRGGRLQEVIVELRNAGGTVWEVPSP